ncbi:hypothetical protein BKA62DRAFT_703810 [Auriculariales sp. MPI-PUGE-AT-0066]|nr:hypothetical protein BKA62DRAFT_703810 [Auriculariales sp. MPI-PUGE-AT-0066]
MRGDPASCLTLHSTTPSAEPLPCSAMSFNEPALHQLLRDLADVSKEKQHTLLSDLFPTPFVFEWTVAASSDVRETLRQAFALDPIAVPTTLGGFYAKAFARVAAAPLLPQLAHTCDRDQLFVLAQRQRDVSTCFDALSELKNASLVFGANSSQRRRSNTVVTAQRPVSPSTPEDGDIPELDMSGANISGDGQDGFFKARQPQGAKKRARRATASVAKSALDERAFRALHLRAPTNSHEAAETGWHIWDKLEVNIEALLVVITSHDCVAALQQAILTASTASSPVSSRQKIKSPSTPTYATPETVRTNRVVNEAPVQSIRGALYLDNIKELGPWRILVASRAERDLRQFHNRDNKTFKIVLKKLKELSDGHFSGDNQKRLTGSDIPIPIFEAKMTGDTRLVYRVDCIPEQGSDTECQVLIIYGVYTHAQLERGYFWNSVGLQISRRGREYRKRCTIRGDQVGLKGDNVFLPQPFPALPDNTDEDATDLSGLTIPQRDLGELHDLLVLEKFVLLSQPLLNSMIADVDVTHPFNPSPYEKKIIEHPASCYVIGRSGTGKTTTLLFRLLGRERAYNMEKDNIRKPRQLFVTQSRVLAGKVEGYYRKLHDSIGVAESSPKALKQPGGGSDIMSRHTQRVEDLLHDNDEQNYRSDLPNRFSELRDEHFPLFLTMEKLSEMIEADAAAAAPDSYSPKTAGTSTSPVQATIGMRLAGVRKLLDYTIWRTQYWPHFAEHLTKGLDPALVYSEIMGVIKGSEESLLHAGRYLDLASYEAFSIRRQSTFANQRKRIYDIFTATHAILAYLQSDISIIGQPIDYLYVDEAQDNLLVDTLMLRIICSNPDGLFWAGDTAQTISVGSSFRFNDLRAFLHRAEEKRTSNMNEVVANEPPALFQLTINYRSHGGIVSCAHSIITLITQFWPDTIDHLAAERGLVDGVKPVFFTGWDEGNARYDQFLFGSKDNHIEFGARQCIIVRNEEAKDKLRAEVGEVGVIFTVMEAKGLEFDDVLIFNFFGDSTVSDQQWRVVLNALTDAVDQAGVPAPTFDAIRHAGVCADLKSLYVAITRARKNMWIVDRSERGEPMRAVWTANGQVQNCTPDTEVPHIAVGSSQDEWVSQARSLFKHGRFSQARHCFERAEQPHHAAVAHAYHLRTIADGKVVSGARKVQDERSQAYLEAGAAFEAAATPEDWGFNARERRGYFRIAAECLQIAGKEYFPRAARCFEKARENMKAAKLFREAVYFEDAIRIIKKHDLAAQPEAEGIVKAAKLYYFRGGQVDKGCKLFDDVDEAIEYLEDRGLDVAQAAVLEYMERWTDAAKVHIQEGRMLTAAEMLIKDKTDHSARRALQVVLQALSRQIAFGCIPEQQDPAVQQIKQLLGQLRSLGLTDSIADEIDFFEILVRRDLVALHEFACKFNNIDMTQRDAADEQHGKLLLALHLYFQARPSNAVADAKVKLTTEMILSRNLTLSLVRLLRAQRATADPLHSERIQRLFGFRPQGERQFLTNPPPAAEDILLTEEQLSRLYQSSLLNLIRFHVKDMTSLWSQKGALDIPCMQWFFSSSCTRDGCTNQHIRAEEFTKEDYILRVQAHILPLMILAAVDGLLERREIFDQESSSWSEKLYQALRPITSRMGDPSMLGEAELSRSGALAWLRPQLNKLTRFQDHHITSVVRHTYFATMYFPDHGQARRILADAPLLKDPNALSMNGRPDGPLALGYAMNAIYGPTEVRDSFIHGIEFLQLVLQQGHLIEASVFLDMFEDIMTSFFIARNIISARSKDAVVFPRNWLITTLRRFQWVRSFSAMHLKHLVSIGKEYLSQLLEPAYSNLYHIDPHRFIGLSERVRFGINSNLPGIQQDVIAALQQTVQRHPSRAQYERYQRARDWKDLDRITRSYYLGWKLDCMVQVSRNRFKMFSRTTMQQGVYQITFKSWDELREKLRDIIPGQIVQVQTRQPPVNALSLASPPVQILARPREEDKSRQPNKSGRHGVEQTQDVPAASLIGEATVKPELASLKVPPATTPALAADSPSKVLVHQDMSLVFPESSPEVSALLAKHGDSPPIPLYPAEVISQNQIEATVQTVVNEVPAVAEPVADLLQVPSAPDQEEEEEEIGPVDEEPQSKLPDAPMDRPDHHAAARVIQRWTRRRLGHELTDKTGGLLSRTGYYRMLMRGPLPHLMLALQLAEVKIVAAKADVKKAFQSADPSLPTFDALDEQLTDTNKSFKQLKQHREKLKPGAPLHATRDVQQLEQLVRSCLNFLWDLPAKVPKFYLNGIEDEMLLVQHGILDRPQPRQRAELPTLNIDDLDGGDDY